MHGKQLHRPSSDLPAFDTGSAWRRSNRLQRNDYTSAVFDGACPGMTSTVTPTDTEVERWAMAMASSSHGEVVDYTADRGKI